MENKLYLSGLTVLYVEDELETRTELKKFLERRVGKVITAADGQEALDKIRDIEVDIVIADLIMPKMDGLEMIHIIRKKYPLTKIIITSTVSEMKTVLDTVEIGIVKYIIKPIILTDLDEALLKCAEELQQVKPEAVALQPEERKQLEAQVKKELSTVIKKAAGKGPRDVAVFIHESSLDAVVYDAFTVYEHTLLKKRENYSLVDQCRRSFYNVVFDEIQEKLRSVMKEPVSIESVEINLHNFTDKLTLKKRNSV